MAILMKLTAAWANSGRWWGTGWHGMLQSMKLTRVGYDLETKQQQHTIFTLKIEKKKNTIRNGFEASHMTLVVKNLPANAGDIRDTDWIPGSGRSPGGGHGNPL